MLAEILHKIAEMEPEEAHNYYPRPSLSGPERCIRQLVYWGLGKPRKPFPGRTLHIFDDGNWHEELVADWIEQSAFKLHSKQMKVNAGTQKGITLKGSIDGIITDVLERDYLWENKSINHFTFERFWLGGEIPHDYLTQCALYIRGLQKDNPDITKAVLLLKNKNTSAYMDYLVQYDAEKDSLAIIEKTNSKDQREKTDIIIENITNDAFDKFASVNEYVKLKKLPKRQYDIDHWRCEYCQYGDICWKGYEKEFEDLKTDEMLPAEVATLVKYKKETSAHRLEMEKEEEELKEQIEQVMKDAGARMGRAGDYIVELKLIEKKNLNKSLIPDNILKEATKKSHYTKLNIRKIT